MTSPNVRRAYLGPGLGLATAATLLLETLDARLLSVLTWYHLSFFAVSLAMLGMAAGAVFVFLNPARFADERTPRALTRAAVMFACAIPISHVVNLLIPLPLKSFNPMDVMAVALSTMVLAAPFLCSGVVVTIALTRSGGSVNRLYAYDLAGAAAGCLLVVPLLNFSNLSAAVMAAGAAAAGAAACFCTYAGIRGAWKALSLCAALLAIAVVNTTLGEVVHVLYPKNRDLWNAESVIQETAWNSHSFVILQKPSLEHTFFWGPGRGADQFTSELAWLVIDGEAGTPVTRWDGNPDSLDWIGYDVTSLPYQIRRGGDAAVIGIGGGRDVLAAIWGRARSIVGIDVNSMMIHTLTKSDRDFAGIAARPEVTLVHDDGRAFLSRTDRRFDVIQMSLVDTWAATGAGAFTLSENGLYTLQAWRTFLNRLKPGGVLSVSRWFDPKNVSETNRLAALGAAALIARGVTHPELQLILTVRGSVATLMISTQPFTSADRDTISDVAAAHDFLVEQSPWTPDVPDDRLSRIARSTSPASLEIATSDPQFDYSPPTDQRPYFFNLLKPMAFLRTLHVPDSGVLAGNVRATQTLVLLLAVAMSLVAVLIAAPLLKAGRPVLAAGRFGSTIIFFAAIGFGFMLIQIALLQRFSIYLGHPTYTLSIVLSSMLLFTGIGSLASERISLGSTRVAVILPGAIALALCGLTVALQPVLDRTILFGLPGRSLVVVAFLAPVSMLLGCCFPVGARLTERSSALLAWMWGVNGACGVLGSIAAVAISMWVSIDTNLWIAAALYLSLWWPLRRMS